MKSKLILVLLLFISIISYSENDSIWNVMILKKGEQPEVRSNMIEYNPKGFYLYRNCFYDIELIDKSKQTLRLVDIKMDTLRFVRISKRKDKKIVILPEDTININFKTINNIILVNNWDSYRGKKIKCNKYYFIFFQSQIDNTYESKFDYVFPSREFKNELFPRLSKNGITYHYEYDGKIYYHSGLKPIKPLLNPDEMENTLKAVNIVFDLIVNKRITFPIK